MLVGVRGPGWMKLPFPAPLQRRTAANQPYLRTDPCVYLVYVRDGTNMCRQCRVGLVAGYATVRPCACIKQGFFGTVK